MFKLEAMFGYSMFNFLPVRLPPVFLDFTSPDANIYSVKWEVSEIPFKEYQRQGRVSVLFESLLDESRSTWLFVTANVTKKKIIGIFLCLILRGFSRSASNLYATDVLFILREINSLFTETMQNATMI